MAEVRLRLLRRSAQLQTVEKVICSGRIRGAVSSMTSVICNSNSAAFTWQCNPRKWTLWPSTVTRGQCLWVPGDTLQPTTQGARFYSQKHGPRASFHGGRHNNGSVESEVPLYRTRTAYYDILGVTGHATQAQIKTAYYKQSFRFHPDRNAGDLNAARQFGQVTEAYHILGCTTLRKKYDRGILCLEDVRSAKKPSGKSVRSSPQEATGQRQASSTSSNSNIAKPMYDFDAFYQGHYGEQLERQRLWKQRLEEMEKKKKEKNTSKEMNSMGDMCILIFIPVFLLYLSLNNT